MKIWQTFFLSFFFLGGNHTALVVTHSMLLLFHVCVCAMDDFTCGLCVCVSSYIEMGEKNRWRHNVSNETKARSIEFVRVFFSFVVGFIIIVMIHAFEFVRLCITTNGIGFRRLLHALRIHSYSECVHFDEILVFDFWQMIPI